MSSKVLDARAQVASESIGIVSGEKPGRVGTLERWSRYLLQPVDGASLAIFRICFGILVVIDLLHQTYLIPDFARPQFHFSYLPGIHALPGTLTLAEFGLIAFLAGNIALGFFYRFATIAFLVAYTHFFLVDKAYYQPQFYAICLLALLLCVAPANNVWSLDNADRKSSPVVPRWSVLIFKFQFAAIYFFSGIAKFNSDWMHGYPQKLWIEHYMHVPVIGPVVSQSWFPSFITYGGIASDFLLSTILFWAPTFWLGVAVATITYVINCECFGSSILPWFLVASLGLYARPDWPRRVLAFLTRAFTGKKVETEKSIPGKAAVGVTPNLPTASGVCRKSIVLLAALHLYVAIQIVVPLRQFLYQGNPAWTEMGTRFSWFTVSNFKQIKKFDMRLTDPKTGKSRRIDPVEYLSVWQFKAAIGKPELLRALARYLADAEEQALGVRPTVRAKILVSLNERPAQELVDPNIDLASPEPMPESQWIVPLH